jgi:hypothetical protein
MFGVSSPRRWVSVLLLGLLAVTLWGLAGCGGKEEVDPYVYDSLRRITRGDTLSVGFLFEIDAPEFEYVSGNTAIIRGRGKDQNILEFLVGEDLENTYRNLSGTLLGVQKTFTPQPTHLVLRRIKRNGVIEADSLATPAEYTIPQLLRAGAIDQEMPGAPIPEIGWKRKDIDEARATFLPENEDDPLKTVKSAFANFVYVPRHDLADSVRANPGPDDYAWYAVGDEVALELVELNPGGEWMLHMLKAKDLPLVGAFTVMTLEEDYSQRKIEYEGLGHVVGTMRVEWFQYANTYVKASEED